MWRTRASLRRGSDPRSLPRAYLNGPQSMHAGFAAHGESPWLPDPAIADLGTPTATACASTTDQWQCDGATRSGRVDAKVAQAGRRPRKA